MFLLTVDEDHGVVAAPAELADITPEVSGALFANAFAWNDEIEAFTSPVTPGEDPDEAVVSTMFVLAFVGVTQFVARIAE